MKQTSKSYQMKQQKFTIDGSKGKLSCIMTYPEKDDQKYPIAILMHGFMANKRLEPLKSIAKALSEAGVASLRFDFNGHGRSEGRFCEMNVLNEIEDAEKVYAYVRSLPEVTKIGLLGHSQGGVVAGMIAGRHAGTGSEPACIVQLAAAAVLRDDALNGVLMNKKYDPANPPEKLNVMFHKVGQSYFKVAQTLPIYEESSKYTGPVCLIHGTEDSIVPCSYSERYHELYADSELHILENETHFLNKRRKEVIQKSCDFLAKYLY